MANELMIPLLPCASIDTIRDFYLPLGFTVGYWQVKPNPYLVLEREDLVLHYFGMDGFEPENSYGSCLVIVDDTEPLFEAFSAGLRAQFGKLPITGFPRITRPRRRKNAGNLSGFSLIDPSGNWIRVMARATPDVEQPVPAGKLQEAVANAIVLADSKGDVRQAAHILEATLTRHAADASTDALIEAQVYLAELLIRLDERPRANALLDAVAAAELSAADRERLSSALDQAADLRTD